jgi:oligo-1,6-glucosidase
VTTSSAPSPDPGGSSDWWRSTVFYQVYPKSFADSNGDGVGDLPGLIGRLDYLKWLGVGAIWLSPVYPSPQADNGYDISNYCNIDPVFGSLHDFDELVSQCHHRGIRLVMDFVPNHTSDEHPWFLESRSGRTSPKRDWYWWRDPKPGTVAGLPGSEPNNWQSYFGGSAWEFDKESGQYYLHLFHRKQPDLNWETSGVRAAMFETLNFWVSRGVDGFRLDVVNLISKDPTLPDMVNQADVGSTPAHPPFLMGPRLHEFLRELRTHVVSPAARPLVCIGETLDVTVEDARLLTSTSRGELDMVFQFEHVLVDQGKDKWHPLDLDVSRLRETMAKWQQGLAQNGWNSLYFNNHDQPRSVSRFGDAENYPTESAKLLAAVLHLHRGTPFVFQGEEIAMTNAGFRTVHDLRDVESINFYENAIAGGAAPEEAMSPIRRMGRDNARTPMQWASEEFGGFSTAEPWIAVNPNYTTTNVAAAVEDSDSVLHFYRRLIGLRQTEPTVVHGTFEPLTGHQDSIYAFIRRWDTTHLLVMANLSGATVPADVVGVEDWTRADRLIGNYRGGLVDEGIVQKLRPWECVVYRRSVDVTDMAAHTIEP